MPFLFTHAFLLSALAGLGIPVLLHLLLKQRNPRMRVSTLRFFEVRDTRSSSRRKLRNWLLLLLRLLVFALIVLAFARPYLPDGWGGKTQPTRRDVVIIIDPSLSIRAIDSGKPRWPAVLDEARQILAGLADNDRAALIGMGGKAKVLSGFAPSAVIRNTLDALKPGSTSGDLSEALREANALVSTLKTPGTASVVVISDLQRTGADGLSRHPLPRWLPVRCVRVGPAIAPNVAITDLRLPAEPQQPLTVTVANFGDQGVQNHTLAWFLDGKPISERTFSRGAGQSDSLEWKLPRVGPGWHEIEARLKESDALADDDVRRLAFQVPEPIRVVAIENRSQVRSFEEQTFFLAAALDPFFGGTNAAQSGFSVEILRPETVATALSASGKTPVPDVVLLPAVRSLPSDAVAALNRWVDLGGGVFFFGGESLEPSRFNAEFAALLPAQWGAVTASDAEVPWRIGAYERSSPVFRPFAPARSGGPAVAEFTHRHAVTLAAGCTVLARFDDGQPFLMSRPFGRGWVLLANTSADTAWTDWPKHKSFVPWIAASVGYLADRGEDRRVRSVETLITGTQARIPLGGMSSSNSPAAGFRLGLRSPNATPTAPLEVGADGTGRIEVDTSGFYSISDPSSRERWRLAANPPAIESDLAALDPKVAEQRVARRTDAESDLPPGWFGGESGRQEWWRILLLAALGFLLIETVVANRSTP